MGQNWKLENEWMRLTLSSHGLPENWLVKEKKREKQKQDREALSQEFDGSTAAGSAILRRLENGEEYTAKLCLRRVKQEESQTGQCVEFYVELGIEPAEEPRKQQLAAIVELRYRLEDSSCFLEWGDVWESEGWHLIELTLPSLVGSPVGKHPRFFHCENRGGYLSDLSQLEENSKIHGEGWFQGYPNASVLPVVGIIQERAVAVMEVQGYVCHTILDARPDSVALGVTVPYRIRGKEHTPDILVNQKEIARIDLMALAAKGEERGFAETKKEERGIAKNKKEEGWLAAAKLVRSHFAPMKDDFFDDKFVFIVQNQLGRKEAELDFEETYDLLQKISNLIGGNPMVAFLTGWSQGGHDTSYPNIYTMNPNLGSEEDFQRMKRKVKEELHCTLSLNDNFDDMYKNEFTKGKWFWEKYVARTLENELETFETWNGVDRSYIASMHHYMQPGEDGEKRIRYHGEHYQLKDAILLDAMSWWSIRNDWNPQAPASAVDNLRAKFEIIRRFYEDYGIRVLSELVRYPFIGRLPVAFDNGVAYHKPSAHDIPFLREALRGVMYYGGRGGDDLDVPDMLYHNAAKHPWFRKGESAERIADIFYLNYVPWFLLHRLELTGYAGQDGVYDLRLEQDSKIHIDYPQETWYATYHNVKILEGNRLTCPLGEDRIAFYGKEEGILCYEGLGQCQIKEAVCCEEDGSVPAKAWVEDGKLYAKVPGGRAVLVTLEQEGCSN